MSKGSGYSWEIWHRFDSICSANSELDILWGLLTYREQSSLGDRGRGGGSKTHSHLRQQPTNQPSIHPSYRMYCTYLGRYIQYIARRYLSPANHLPEITTQTLTLYVSHDIHLICFIP